MFILSIEVLKVYKVKIMGECNGNNEKDRDIQRRLPSVQGNRLIGPTDGLSVMRDQCCRYECHPGHDQGKGSRRSQRSGGGNQREAGRLLRKPRS